MAFPFIRALLVILLDQDAAKARAEKIECLPYPEIVQRGVLGVVDDILRFKLDRPKNRATATSIARPNRRSFFFSQQGCFFCSCHFFAMPRTVGLCRVTLSPRDG
jgi:hypothetical protein